MSSAPFFGIPKEQENFVARNPPFMEVLPRLVARINAEIRRRLGEWQSLIARKPEVARQLLRRLLVGRLKLTPHATTEARWYEVQGEATYGQLFEGLPCVVGVVPPG